MPADSSTKKQRPAPGSMYFPPTTAATIASPTAASANGSSPRKTSPYNSFANAATMTKALTPNKPLGDLLRSIEPRYAFHPGVEELLLDMATDFVTDVTEFSGRLAKHRRSTVLEAKDLQFSLAKNYGISLAGVNLNIRPGTASANVGALTAAGGDVLNPLGQDLLVRARPSKNSLHMHRMALKRKTLQKTKAKLKSARPVKISDGTPRKLIRKNSTSMDAK